MVAAAISTVVMARVLSALLFFTRSGLQIANYSEMETQARQSGLIMIPSYLKLSRSATTMGQVAHALNNASNLAESGLEHAMWALTEDIVKENSSAWDAWEIVNGGDDVRRTISGIDFGTGITGQVNIYIIDYKGTPDAALAKATVTLPREQARKPTTSCPEVSPGRLGI